MRENRKIQIKKGEWKKWDPYHLDKVEVVDTIT